jgi:hypothetical protein
MMVKKYIVILLMVVGTLTLSAQDEVKQISRKACDCMSELKISGADKDEMNTKLGLCFISASNGHEKYLKEKHGIVLSGKNAKKSGKKLGELIAVRAIIDCPSLIMAMVSGEGFAAAQVEYKKAKVAPPIAVAPAIKSVTGKVISVGKVPFASFDIKGTDGFTTKLYWIDFFDKSSVLLEDVTELKAKKLSFTFIEKKVFFAAKNSYELVKVVTGVTILQ